ncbi:zinc finger, CCHC-type containing protein [Tanacetum coccineum]
MAAPPSLNHVFNFLTDEPHEFDDSDLKFEEDPQEEFERIMRKNLKRTLKKSRRRLQRWRVAREGTRVENTKLKRELKAAEISNTLLPGVVGVRPCEAIDVLTVYGESHPPKLWGAPKEQQQRSLINGIEDIGGSVVPKEVTKEVAIQQPKPELRKSKWNRTPKKFGLEFELYLIEGTRDEVFDQHSYCFNVEDDPKTFDEVMKSQDVAFWKEAINDEMDSILDNNTWVLADLPPGCKPLGCKWIFKIKLKVDGTIEKLKARLVIQGFRQKSRIDYFDTYTTVARISTIRLLIAMTSIHNLIIHQMDVKTTFLNGELDEEVYMNKPQGFIMPGNKNKEFLSSRFSMKDVGEANVILDIRIKHESVSTPMDTSEKLMPNNGQVVSQLEYSRVIDCLTYVMICTRLDIAFVVGKLSRYTSNPSTQHWQAIQRVLKYLKKTMDYSLIYTDYPSVLEGYTDASWISNTEDNSSTSGWVFLLSGGAFYWASKKQTCITSSILEYEFMALAATGKEDEWLRNLILKILMWSKPIAPISINYDSAATLGKAYRQMYNGKSRHLGVTHIMIREFIMNGVVSMKFVRSQQNLAGHLTKGLARDLVIKSTEGMGLKSNLWTEAHVLQSSQGCALNVLKKRMETLLLYG